VDAGDGTGQRELGVSRDHLQRHPAVREELAHRCELGPVEMSAALPQLGPGLSLDLVGIGIGTDQDLALEAGVGLEGEAAAGEACCGSRLAALHIGACG